MSGESARDRQEADATFAVTGDAGQHGYGRQLAVLYEIVEAVHAGSDLDQLMDNLVNAVVSHGPWPMCWLGFYDPAVRLAGGRIVNHPSNGHRSSGHRRRRPPE